MKTSISERDFQAQVLQLARLSGWMAYHTRDSRRSEPGFPDLVLVRPPMILFAELKTGAGKVRPEQRTWLAALAGCEGVDVALWRPSDWKTVEEVLKR